jgi:hypothetical protein
MSATVLPELAAESVETAERLVRLSAEEELDAAEAEYILASGVAAIQRVSGLWLITRKRIGRGTISATAQKHLAQLLEAVDKNLFLAGVLQGRARILRERAGYESGTIAGLAAATEEVVRVRAEVVRLLEAIDAPARWPGDDQLREAKEHMRRGKRLTEDEFRRAVLGE